MSADPDIHRLLARQLRRLGVDPTTPPSPEAWRGLVDVVSRSYATAEEDRYLLERSLDVSSREMEALYEGLRQASESRVAAERDRLRSVLEALSDGLFVLDAAGRVENLNGAAAAMFGVLSADVMGAPILQRLRLRRGGEAEADAAEALRAVVERRDELAFDDSHLLRGERPPLPVACTLTPLSAGEAAVGCVLVVHDMSAVRRSEVELRRLNDALRTARDRALDASRAKSAFLANMSHELRTPLNAIIGYCELMGEELADLGERSLSEDNQRVNQAARHLLQVINDILDVSKIEAGKMELDVEDFAVEGVIEEVTGVIEPVVARQGNSLEIAVPAGPLPMTSDRTKLKQALFNLLANAAKFTREGTIRLEVRRRAEEPIWYEFAVRDTGIGIAPDRIRDLFDAFIQADVSTTRRFGGTGLGLTITREFCRMMGGEVTVESRLGEGSVFTLHLPARLEARGR